MKRLFHLLFLLMLVGLTYLSYLQWFSPSRPVEYLPPVASSAPEHLDLIPLVDLQGNRNVLHLKDHSITLFAADQFHPESSFYHTLSPYHRVLSQKDIKIIYLWQFLDENEKSKINDIVKPEDVEFQYLLNDRILAEYQQLGINIREEHLFAYDQDGKLIYELDHQTPYSPDELVREITLNLLNH